MIIDDYCLLCYHVHHTFSVETSGFLRSTNIQTMAAMCKAKLLSCEYKAAVADCSAVPISGQFFQRETRSNSVAVDSLSVRVIMIVPPCMVCKGDSVELPSSCSASTAAVMQFHAAIFGGNLEHNFVTQAVKQSADIAQTSSNSVASGVQWSSMAATASALAKLLKELT